ncbi:hypothetical protein FB45DRAFT_704736, partial [Roridomyces roridus]
LNNFRSTSRNSNRPPTPPLVVDLPRLSETISTSDIHPQTQSPLFGVLFPEIRNIIFIHALREYDDRSKPYDQHSYYYRPGYECAGKIATDLPLTCRVIYLETHLAPVALNEHVFWYESGRAPPGKWKSNDNAYFGRMTEQQRAAVQRVHVFPQMFWLEKRSAQRWLTGLKGFSLTITIRHTDWWFWEDGEPLRMEEPTQQWGKWIGSMPQIKELEFEFETIDEKKGQLEERVRSAVRWKFPLEGGGKLVHDGYAPVQSMWLGSS